MKKNKMLKFGITRGKRMRRAIVIYYVGILDIGRSTFVQGITKLCVVKNGKRVKQSQVGGTY